MKIILSLACAITLLTGSVGVALAQTSPAPNPQKSYNDAYVARINKINERYWRRQTELRCKAEAKQAYSAIHFKKRRAFVRECIARAGR